MKVRNKTVAEGERRRREAIFSTLLEEKQRRIRVLEGEQRRAAER